MAVSQHAIIHILPIRVKVNSQLARPPPPKHIGKHISFIANAELTEII